jgi:hypothetical protein
MNHYRLLRDNKETGPYSTEDLIQKGFKAYDLIWVEGKSAGWRYPSELPEFKSYAPVVEEQPFDRFFRKGQQPESHPVLESKKARQQMAPFGGEQQERPQPVSAGNALPEKNISLPKEEIPAPKEFIPTATPPVVKDPIFNSDLFTRKDRKIHVTMPAGRTFSTVHKIDSPPAPPGQEPAKESLTVPKTEPKPVKPQPRELSPEIREQSFQEKEVTTRNPVTETLPKRVTYPRIRAKSKWMETENLSPTLMAGFLIGMATLLGLGIMIGLSISRSQKDMEFRAAIEHQSKPLKQVPATHSTNQPQPNSSVSDPTASQSQESLLQANHPINKTDRHATVSNPIPQPVEVTQKSPEMHVVSSSPGGSLVIPAVQLEKQVALATNHYHVGAFGGISELECTLTNDSRYSLDEVEVELQYILANEKIYKTEKILFREISPGTQITINAPKSSRGIRVTGKITRIQSKDAGQTGTTVRS